MASHHVLALLKRSFDPKKIKIQTRHFFSRRINGCLGKVLNEVCQLMANLLEIFF